MSEARLRLPIPSSKGICICAEVGEVIVGSFSDVRDCWLSLMQVRMWETMQMQTLQSRVYSRGKRELQNSDHNSAYMVFMVFLLIP